MKTLTTLLLLLAIMFLCLWYYGKRSYKHRRVSQAKLESYFEVLLTRGFNGGFMVVEVPRTRFFIQFSKYILKSGHAGLELNFPVAPWSKRFHESLEYELKQKGFHYVTRRVDRRDVSEFLTVDLEKDANAAAMLTRTVLKSVFGIDETAPVSLYFGNVSPKTERIGV